MRTLCHLGNYQGSPKILLKPIDFVFQSLFFSPVARFWGSPKKNTPLLLLLGAMKEIVKDSDGLEGKNPVYFKNHQENQYLRDIKKSGKFSDMNSVKGRGIYCRDPEGDTGYWAGF